MTTLALPAMLLAGVLAVTGFGRDGHMMMNDVDGYDVRLERPFEGTVAGPFRVVDGMLYFKLETAMRIVDVQLGPKEFVEQSGFAVSMGDVVTVVGIPRMMRMREVVLAREVRTAMEVFVVRDRNGKPRWDTQRPVEMDPEHTDEPMCALPVF